MILIQITNKDQNFFNLIRSGNKINVKFDIITITETKLQQDEPTEDINLSEHKFESTPTEAEKGGTLIYISKNLEHKRRKDLEIYEKKKIEIPLHKYNNFLPL